MDAQTIIQTGLLAVAAWGLVRFVSDVEKLGKRMDAAEKAINDCCGERRRRPRNATRG